jgi:hypothetical protein
VVLRFVIRHSGFVIPAHPTPCFSSGANVVSQYPSTWVFPLVEELGHGVVQPVGRPRAGAERDRDADDLTLPEQPEVIVSPAAKLVTAWVIASGL